MFSREYRDAGPREGNHAPGSCGGLMERVVGEEEIDGGVSPHHARLTISLNEPGRFLGERDAQAGERAADLREPLDRDEDVQVDVDCRPRFGVVGQRQRSAEGVRNRGERPFQLEDSLRE